MKGFPKGKNPREELERVLSSSCFGRSGGLSRLLRFLVERQLEGRASELKESLIGVEVYGRSPDYDPKLDSTVRSELTRLRARLSKYYSTEDSQDLLVIELPKGGYVPAFRQFEPMHDVWRSRGRRLGLATCMAGFGVAAAASAGWWLLQRSPPIPIAVLPLEKLLADQLERWAGVGPVRIGFTLTAPEFAFARADPRVKALRRGVGLPE